MCVGVRACMCVGVRACMFVGVSAYMCVGVRGCVCGCTSEQVFHVTMFNSNLKLLI